MRKEIRRGLGILGLLTAGAVFGPSMMEALATNSPTVDPEVKKIRQVQSEEIQALTGEHAEELKKMKETLEAERLAFEKREKEERAKLFKETKSGAERREHIRGFIQRRADLKKKSSDAIATFNAEFAAKLKAKKAEQAEALAKIKAK